MERGRAVVRCDDVHGDHRVRLFELRGGSKRVRYRSSAGSSAWGAKCDANAYGSPSRRELRAVEARAEDPDRNARSHTRIANTCWPGRGSPSSLQLQNVLRERVGARILPEGPQRQLVGARRTPHPEVDPARVQRLQRPELLGDHERRVIRQHHATRADTNRLRSLCDVGDHHGRRRTRDSAQVVVLGDPVTAEAESLRLLREVQRVAQRPPGVPPTTIGARSRIATGSTHRRYRRVTDRTPPTRCRSRTGRISMRGRLLSEQRPVEEAGDAPLVLLRAASSPPTCPASAILHRAFGAEAARKYSTFSSSPPPPCPA